LLREMKAIVKKDFKQARRDPRFIAPSLIVPFVLALVYTILWVQVGGGESFVCGLVVEDQSSQAEEMADILENMVSTTNHTWFKTTRYDSETAAQMFQDNLLIAYILIPDGFGLNVSTGNEATVVIYVANYNDDVVKNYVHRIEAGVLLYNQGAVYPHFDQSDAPVSLEETLARPMTPSNTAYMYAVAIILSLIVCSVTGQGLSTATEYETQAIYDLLNSPTSRLAIVIGRTISAIPRSLVVLLITVPVILLSTGTLPVGNIWVLSLIMLLTILSLAPIGELIGTRTKNRELAILGSVLFSVIGFLAGGGLAPIGLMPLELRLVSLLLPTTHVLGLWTRVFFLDTVTGILPSIVALLVTWLVLTAVVSTLMKREVEHT